ncbi:hypothetical protein DFQ28_005345 [Apophysomyces sp. BC1034]|nr:hypothetical protein DFQ30_005217 [Apophysomyces sp. BC1015]KAG0177866.1 hypothetical protein DFQ29_004263 [Apophysomyces sp. BC1021]KAG0188116.1 hypothetical protein DFQ28_005345 [Apophysomyces sp. BC1034]
MPYNWDSVDIESSTDDVVESSPQRSNEEKNWQTYNDSYRKLTHWDNQDEYDLTQARYETRREEAELKRAEDLYKILEEFHQVISNISHINLLASDTTMHLTEQLLHLIGCAETVAADAFTTCSQHCTCVEPGSHKWFPITMTALITELGARLSWCGWSHDRRSFSAPMDQTGLLKLSKLFGKSYDMMSCMQEIRPHSFWESSDNISQFAQWLEKPARWKETNPETIPQSHQVVDIKRIKDICTLNTIDFYDEEDIIGEEELDRRFEDDEDNQSIQD